MKSLSELAEQCNQCRACQLSEHATHKAFGEGLERTPEVLFVGEGPGQIEDELGRPFVGPAGKLLRAAIAEYRLDGEVYATNIVKCRPPGNREPHEDEIKSCFHFLAKQVDLIKPQCIVTLGNPATRTILGPDTPGITKVNGKLFRTKAGRPVVPIIHPAAVLHNEDMGPLFYNGFDALISHLLDISGCPF